MSQEFPQILEPILDEILAGTLTQRSTRESVLRTLLVIRRRYNDPTSGPLAECDGYLGGTAFSNKYTTASQKARVEAGIAYLKPLVGDTVEPYPPLAFVYKDLSAIDRMGHLIPTGKP